MAARKGLKLFVSEVLCHNPLLLGLQDHALLVLKYGADHTGAQQHWHDPVTTE